MDMDYFHTCKNALRKFPLRIDVRLSYTLAHIKCVYGLKISTLNITILMYNVG